ncbi:hypothetical protein [Limnoglobus roseus]|uniref:Uncharacterized protein n=1 Tax=Limnoglobus roseus TaxID=2598579 RepID=A0A5C1ARJ3_9BACT|nr:hypothetical protein [Limnoglobus roseus]QEL20703.1 hypothetical protein PX52LOC_07812 [Limnoglobus roseus]
MIRSLLCCAAVVGATSALRAGELDGDRPAPTAATQAAVPPAAATELDGESPTAAHRYGGWGYGGGYRGGFGSYYGGYRGGWGYGGYRSYYGGYGGGWGYRSGWGGYGVYSSFYQPSFFGYSTYGYYGGNCW